MSSQCNLMFLEIILHILVCFHYMFLSLNVELYDIQIIIVLFSSQVSNMLVFPLCPQKKSAFKMIDRSQKCLFPNQRLTYLGPSLLLEHRPCTTSLQRLLSWAILSSCFQLSPVCVMSPSMSCRQVFLVSPSFACP